MILLAIIERSFYSLVAILTTKDRCSRIFEYNIDFKKGHFPKQNSLLLKKFFKINS